MPEVAAMLMTFCVLSVTWFGTDARSGDLRVTFPVASRSVETGATEAGASDQPSARAKLIGILQRRAFPPSNEILAVGPTVDRELVGVAEDRTLSPLVRVRAARALVHVRTPEARAFHARWVAAARGPVSAVELAIIGEAAMALGSHPDGTTVEQLGPLLAHPSPELRKTAAVALGLTAKPSALAALVDRRRVERRPAVRAALDEQIARIELLLGVRAPAEETARLGSEPPTNREHVSPFTHRP